METIRIYGEAQLQRSLKNEQLNMVIYHGDDNKSLSILNHLKTLATKKEFSGIKVMLIERHRLPEEYYMRRGITTTPTVCYYIGKNEMGRMTGLHTLNMLINGIKRHRHHLSDVA